MRSLPDQPSPAATLATASSPRGEIVLRRRADDGALELRVNGVFVMDTVHTATERELGRIAVGAPERAGATVLIGGLGLGFTLAEVLASPAVGTVLVAEIEPAVVDWHWAGIIPQTVAALADRRVRIVTDDVRAVVAAQPAGSLDVIALDVDNGPGYLVYDANAALYERAFLERSRAALAPTGRLVVWSAAASADFERRLRATFGSAAHTAIAVDVGTRPETYVVYEAPAPAAPTAAIAPAAVALNRQPTS